MASAGGFSYYTPRASRSQLPLQKLVEREAKSQRRQHRNAARDNPKAL
jgi:hypothetical protein